MDSIHPAYLWTPVVANHLRTTAPGPEAARVATAAAHHIGNMGTPGDLAWAVVCWASVQATFVTGAEIVIDGGYRAR